MKYKISLSGTWTDLHNTKHNLESTTVLEAKNKKELKSAIEDFIVFIMNKNNAVASEGTLTVTEFEEKIIMKEKPFKISLKIIPQIEIEYPRR